MQGHNTDLVFV